MTQRGSSARGSSAGGSARALAAGVLGRVHSDDAYAAAALSSALTASGLAAPDRALATELTYGVLRTENYLRRRLEAHGRMAHADEHTLLHLLLGAYQLDFLTRVPPHAVVNEAVELTRAGGSVRAAGFVNAILRRLAEDRHTRLPLRDAVLASTPSWLRKRLTRDVGENDAVSLLAPERAPQATLRFRPERAPRDWVASGTEPVSGLAAARRYIAGGDPRSRPGYADGDFVVQELGAQWVGQMLLAQPGERVLDLCAGRGHKSALLLDAGAQVVATELHENKVSQLREELQRLGLVAQTVVHDWTQAAPSELVGRFDAVLVDAPCTGIGTLRRRPEILRRLTPETPARLAALQASLLRQAERALAPGGRLVFATCSVLREEAEDVLAQVSDVLVPLAFTAAPPPGLPEGASALRFLPRTTQSDGYFVACLKARTRG